MYALSQGYTILPALLNEGCLWVLGLVKPCLYSSLWHLHSPDTHLSGGGFCPFTDSYRPYSRSSCQYRSQYFSVTALLNVSHFRFARDRMYSAVIYNQGSNSDQ